MCPQKIRSNVTSFMGSGPDDATSSLEGQSGNAAPIRHFLKLAPIGFDHVLQPWPELGVALLGTRVKVGSYVHYRVGPWDGFFSKCTLNSCDWCWKRDPTPSDCHWSTQKGVTRLTRCWTRWPSWRKWVSAVATTWKLSYQMWSLWSKKVLIHLFLHWEILEISSKLMSKGRYIITSS